KRASFCQKRSALFRHAKIYSTERLHDAWLQFWRAIAECRIAGFANLNSCTATCPSTEENLYRCPGKRAAVQKFPQALSLHCQHCWKVTSLLLAGQESLVQG